MTNTVLVVLMPTRVLMIFLENNKANKHAYKYEKYIRIWKLIHCYMFYKYILDIPVTSLLVLRNVAIVVVTETIVNKNLNKT